MIYTPHDHQAEAIDFILSHSVCENCRWCREDGGEGEDCGTYHVCCRPGRSRALTQPGDSCSGFTAQPWLTSAAQSGSQSAAGGEA